MYKFYLVTLNKICAFDLVSTWVAAKSYRIICVNVKNSIHIFNIWHFWSDICRQNMSHNCHSGCASCPPISMYPLHINCMRFGWLSLHYVVDIKCMSLQTIICINIHICVTQLPTSAAQIEQLGRLISIDIPVSMAGNAKHVLLVICWTLYVR